MKKAFLYLLLLFCSVIRAEANSCSLPDERNWIPIVQEYIKKSKAVFLGEVFAEKEKGQMWVKVIDVFKGTVADTLIFETNRGQYFDDNSEMMPWPLGVNIFYAGDIQNNVFEELLLASQYGITSCGMSRDITSLYPGAIPPDLPPPPLPSSHIVDEQKYNEYDDKYIIDLQRREIQLFKNWINEYALLNAYRNNNRQIEEPKEDSYKDFLSYITLAFSLLAIFIALFRKQP